MGLLWDPSPYRVPDPLIGPLWGLAPHICAPQILAYGDMSQERVEGTTLLWFPEPSMGLLWVPSPSRTTEPPVGPL